MDVLLDVQYIIIFIVDVPRRPATINSLTARTQSSELLVYGCNILDSDLLIICERMQITVFWFVSWYP